MQRGQVSLLISARYDFDGSRHALHEVVGKPVREGDEAGEFPSRDGFIRLGVVQLSDIERTGRGHLVDYPSTHAVRPLSHGNG